jgi:hypothetical protein
MVCFDAEKEGKYGIVYTVFHKKKEFDNVYGY